MNIAELKTALTGIKGASMVSIDLVSKPSNMRVKCNLNRDCKKHVTISGIIGMSYENGVNNQLEREGKEAEFKSQKPSWFIRTGDMIGTNKAGDKTYLPIKVQSSSKPRYILDDVDVSVSIAFRLIIPF